MNPDREEQVRRVAQHLMESGIADNQFRFIQKSATRHISESPYMLCGPGGDHCQYSKRECKQMVCHPQDPLQPLNKRNITLVCCGVNQQFHDNWTKAVSQGTKLKGLEFNSKALPHQCAMCGMDGATHRCSRCGTGHLLRPGYLRCRGPLCGRRAGSDVWRWRRCRVGA